MVRGDRGDDPVDARDGAAAAVFARLSGRQQLVAVWITAGFSDHDVARHLGIADEELYSELDEIARVVLQVML